MQVFRYLVIIVCYKLNYKMKIVYLCSHNILCFHSVCSTTITTLVVWISHSRSSAEVFHHFFYSEFFRVEEALHYFSSRLASAFCGSTGAKKFRLEFCHQRAVELILAGMTVRDLKGCTHETCETDWQSCRITQSWTSVCSPAFLTGPR